MTVILQNSDNDIWGGEYSFKMSPRMTGNDIANAMKFETESEAYAYADANGMESYHPVSYSESEVLY
jgi:hypothetical protein